LWLSEIPDESYKRFIRDKFEEHRRSIDDDAIDFILWWTFTHTYYTQIICNGVFANCGDRVTLDKVKQVCENQLDMQRFTFMQYRNILSPVQWQLLLAIAKEGAVAEPQSQKFLQKYKIGSPSSAKKALEALLAKEMIYTVEREEKTAYRVYDVFLMRWLERTFHV
ncbi:MAG: ATP-binding protein, partial [Tannerellaceae bacterium]|nr:ATP-binding protein [Tannerellaceae bacterium]